MTGPATDKDEEGSSFEHTVIQGTAQPLQAVAQFKQRKHLDIVSNKSGIAGSFKDARSRYFAYLKIDVAVTCQLFFWYHSKANSKTYPLIP